MNWREFIARLGGATVKSLSPLFGVLAGITFFILFQGTLL